MYLSLNTNPYDVRLFINLFIYFNAQKIQRESEREEETWKDLARGGGEEKGKRLKEDSSVMVSYAWSSIFNEAKVNVFTCSFTRKTPQSCPS